MKSVFKLAAVVIVFTIVFFLIRTYFYNVDLLIGDLGGVVYLYSTVTVIFAIFAGFIVVSESQDWNTLSAAQESEIQQIHELWLWANQLSEPLKEKFNASIMHYLETVYNEEWKMLRKGKESKKAEAALDSFHELIKEAGKENHNLYANLSTSFNNILSARATRIEFCYEPLPQILKFTLYLVDISVIVLSLFIGVKDIRLDYIFMLCIVTLGTVILFVVEDLDNPLRPGEWYLSPEPYRKLMNRLHISLK